jgi:uncharacterized surface protein with fasciclin (FAS1) repeats
MKKAIKFLWLLLIGGLLISCDLFKSDDLVEEEPKSLVQLIDGNADLSMLKTVIERNSDLLDDLGNENSKFTMFAPSNQAFNNLIESMGGVNSLSDIDDEILFDFVKYHIISGTVLKVADMQSGDSPATLLGELISMTVSGSAVKLNGLADISSADNEAENGIIHVINAVLMPSAYILLENEFLYKRNKYPLGWGFYYNYGFNSGYTNYDLVMTEVEENLEEIEDSEDLQSDHYVYLWLEFEGSSFIEGRFEFNENGFEEGDEKFIYQGGVWFEDIDEEIAISGGFVDIEIEGDIYTIIMNLTLENGEDLRGHMSYPFEEQQNDDGGSGEISNTGDNYESDFNFYIDDLRFPISHSIVHDYGDFDGSGYNIDIELFSRDPDSEDLAGTHYFYFELFSESTETFVDGQYVFDNSYPAGVNHFGFSSININVNQGTANVLFINSGTVDISTSNNELDISFELTDTYGREIYGNYTGSFDGSETSRSSKIERKYKLNQKHKNTVFNKSRALNQK